jgi:ribonuclease-3
LPPSSTALAEALGLRRDSEALALALTHSSYAAEHDCASNERLEFLGDAVVDLAIADLIVREYPHLDEGASSVARSRVVNEESLARAATRLDLARYVRIGKGVVKEQGLERPSLLADAFESVVAALYLERGYEVAKAFVHDALGDDVARACAQGDTLDAKTRLRRWAHERGHAVPEYELVAEGPAHETEFVATVRVGGRVLGTGRAASKKRAELLAAAHAWEARDDA